MRALVLGARLLVGGVILFVLFRIVPLRGVVDALAGARALPLVGAAASLLALRYFGALRLRLLTASQGMRLSVRQLFEIHLMTGFYNLFLPGIIAGGAVTWHKCCQIDHKPTSAIASIFYSRFVDTTMLVAAGLAFWIVDVRRSSSGWTGGELVLLLAVLACAYALVFHQRLAPVRRAIWKIMRARGPAVLHRKLHGFVASVRRFGALPRATFAWVLLLTALRFATGVVIAACYARAVSLPLPLVTLGWTRSLVEATAMFPVTVSGLGLREGSLVALLSHRGWPATLLTAWSFLFFVGQLFVAVVGGVLEARAQLMRGVAGRARASSGIDRP